MHGIRLVTVRRRECEVGVVGQHLFKAVQVLYLDCTQTSMSACLLWLMMRARRRRLHVHVRSCHKVIAPPSTSSP